MPNNLLQRKDKLKWPHNFYGGIFVTVFFTKITAWFNSYAHANHACSNLEIRIAEVEFLNFTVYANAQPVTSQCRMALRKLHLFHLKVDNLLHENEESKRNSDSLKRMYLHAKS